MFNRLFGLLLGDREGGASTILIMREKEMYSRLN